MHLREIVLVGSLFLSGIVFGQEKLKFEVSSKGEGFLNPKISHSILKADKNEIDFSFLFGIYSMKFMKINESNYREIVKNNFPWEVKEEYFDYSKDSCYIFKNYSVKKGDSREEKEVLEGRVFDKKYKTVPELFGDFEKGLLGDSIHFIVNGMPYSVKVESKEEKNRLIYSCTLEVKRDSGDIIIAPYPIEVYAIKKNGKLIPIKFSTTLLNVRSDKKINIEGILRED